MQTASLLRETPAAAAVTGPVSKEGLQSVGFSFPGQTEFFAHAFSREEFGMLLTGPSLIVGLATIQIPLADPSSMIAAIRLACELA